jgi:hypothetical protein
MNDIVQKVSALATRHYPDILHCALYGLPLLCVVALRASSRADASIR